MINNIENTESNTHDRCEYDMKRMDSDVALYYRLNSNFKLFIGGKYMSFTYPVDGYDYTFYHSLFGPGAGISAVFPVVEHFYLLANIGGIYTRGKQVNKGSAQICLILIFINTG